MAPRRRNVLSPMVLLIPSVLPVALPAPSSEPVWQFTSTNRLP